MALSPQELDRINKLEKLVQSLLRVENVEFIKNIERRITVPAHKLSDHTDADIASATTGQIIKLNASGVWEPATDNT